MPTSALEPAPTTAPAVTPATLPVTESAAGQPSLPQIDLNNPAVMALVESARREEKDKLYRDQESLRTQIKELKEQLNSRLSPDEKVQTQLADVQRQLSETTAKLEALQTEAKLSAEQNALERRRLQLQSYLDRRLREEQAKGTKLMLELVGGTTEAEVEASIQLAASEYARLRDTFFTEFQAQQPAPPLPSPPPVVLPVAVTAVPALSPAAFPSAPNAPSVPAVEAGTPAFVATVSELTSPEAVRDGRYQQHREKLLAAVRQGPTPPAGQPFAQAPRNLSVPVTEHGAVTQPQGLPTPPVSHPQMVQGAPQPLPIAPTAAPPVQPSAPSPESFRDAAIRTIHRDLSHPSSAQRAAVVGAQPPRHAEYGGGKPVAVSVADFAPQVPHPMVRNS